MEFKINIYQWLPQATNLNSVENLWSELSSSHACTHDLKQTCNNELGTNEKNFPLAESFTSGALMKLDYTLQEGALCCYFQQGD